MIKPVSLGLRIATIAALIITAPLAVDLRPAKTPEDIAAEVRELERAAKERGVIIKPATTIAPAAPVQAKLPTYVGSGETAVRVFSAPPFVCVIVRTTNRDMLECEVVE